MDYNHIEIEKKWRKEWADKKTFKAEDNSEKPKFYALDMFPYPSGAGLHVGHPLGYIASDIYARYKRHQGFNVLHPMGYDSFGLPAEQYAIQTGQHPAVTTKTNIEGGTDKAGNKISGYRNQLDIMGFSFDWDREVRTSNPEYYKWTQWIFKQIFNSWYNEATNKAEDISELIAVFEKEGNANIKATTDQETIFTAEQWSKFTEKEKQETLMNYRLTFLSDTYVNWCPALGTVLANDEIKDGVSERGGHPVERKLMRQWSMRITAYANRLIQDLDTVDWTDSIKEQQKNWIGKSRGASIKFRVLSPALSEGKGDNKEVLPLGKDLGWEFIEVFTTRPDTIFGVNFMVLAPEHELVNQITTPEYKAEVEVYQLKAKGKSERDRQANVKEISGQNTGAFAIHPFTGEKVQIWIGDYVLASYGTGAVMAVPAGDQRDWDFANHFGIEIKNIFADTDISEGAYEGKDAELINSDFLNGLTAKKAIGEAIKAIQEKGFGKGKTQFRLRDAIFSRQRYWGEPFPVYYKNGLPYLIEDKNLPIVLPEVEKYLPTEDGAPPLGNAEKWFWNEQKQEITSFPTPTLPEGEGVDSFPFNDYGYNTANPNKAKVLIEFAREMRKKPTPAEELLWSKLRNKQLGVKFRRQHYFGDFIVDFVSLKDRLVIEVDGDIHDYQKEYDNVRTDLLNKNGLKVIRFKNEEVLKNTESVLKTIKNNLTTPPLSEGVGGRLELNTMPGWAGSSWYFLRYMDPKNENEFVSKEKADYWNQVDLYIGGAEHATGHLLYSRFWCKFLFDKGLISFNEPFKKMINQGMILGRSSFVYRWVYVIFAKKKNSVDNLMISIPPAPLLVSFDCTETKFSKSLNKEITTYKEDFLKENDLREKLLMNSVGKYEGYYLNNISGTNSAQFSKIASSTGSKLFVSSEYDYEIKNISEELTKFNVDINRVDNDVLNQDLFCDWREDFDNSVFIVNDGKYICGHEIEKMSKSKFNVQTPDELVERYGADTLRCYEMFLGPLEQAKPWDTKGISGVSSFLKKLWRLFHQNETFTITKGEPDKKALKSLHTIIKKANDDLERYSFNTIVSGLMIAVNELQEQKCNNKEILSQLLIIASPYAPHITEELWSKLGNKNSISQESWPVFNPKFLEEDAYSYPVSFNGKMRFLLELPTTLSKEEIEKEVLASEQSQKYLEGKTPKKIIIVPKKIVNIVI